MTSSINNLSQASQKSIEEYHARSSHNQEPYVAYILLPLENEVFDLVWPDSPDFFPLPNVSFLSYYLLVSKGTWVFSSGSRCSQVSSLGFITTVSSWSCFSCLRGRKAFVNASPRDFCQQVVNPPSLIVRFKLRRLGSFEWIA